MLLYKAANRLYTLSTVKTLHFNPFSCNEPQLLMILLGKTKLLRTESAKGITSPRCHL